MIKKITCIICPLGCALEVDAMHQRVKGHSCKRGEIYGLEEVIAPKRVITTTVKLIGSRYPMVPVKTNGAIPKNLNFKCMDLLKTIEIKAPVRVGDVIIENVLGTGINVVATRTIKAE